jgi:hypothetical protein
MDLSQLLQIPAGIHLSDIQHRLHPLAGHPIAGVAIAALLAALIDQRRARRRTPDFSIAYNDVKGPPPR